MEPEPVAPQDAAEPLLDLEVSRHPDMLHWTMDVFARSPSHISKCLGVQAYASSYTGHARVARLLFIAGKTAGTQMELEALRLAADQLRKVML